VKVWILILDLLSRGALLSPITSVELDFPNASNARGQIIWWSVLDLVLVILHHGSVYQDRVQLSRLCLAGEADRRDVVRFSPSILRCCFRIHIY